MAELINQANLAGAVLIMVFIFICLIRAVIGPTAPDRVVAINMIGTKTVLIIALTSFIYQRGFYLDVAMVYALMSFIAALGISKYLEKGALD